MEIKKIIDAYIKQSNDYMLEIEKSYESKNKKRENLVISPSYIKDVIIPILEATSDIMPKYKKIKIPNTKTYLPIKEYYRINVGPLVVGGFSVPDGDDYSIYFTPLKNVTPIGEKIKIDTIEQLCKYIILELDR